MLSRRYRQSHRRLIEKDSPRVNSIKVSISISKDLLRQIETLAAAESCSRSEIIRRAVRQYIARKQRWQELFQYGEAAAKSAKLTPQDIEKEIASYRKEKRAREMHNQKPSPEAIRDQARKLRTLTRAHPLTQAEITRAKRSGRS
jgi:CopG family transcriptional regulator / antitoxin EndoAI